ncbi:hypothetical protein [Anaerolentibacter hominis]|uniref:hypothetical protein n=1 Tax=Anaerolentibacter hominis TaxID=3079009 RepID=UPI0031B8214C
MRERFRAWIARAMDGRNGIDPLGWFLVALYVILLFVANFTISWTPLILCLGVIVLSFYRAFSKNLKRRQAENEFFVGIFRPIGRLFGKASGKKKEKKFRNVKCSNCGTRYKVPNRPGYRGECPNCHRRE